MKLNKYLDTKFATDMLPSLHIGWFQVDIRSNKKDRKIAEKYGLEYNSMRIWKWIYFILSFVSVFLLSNLMYERLPAFITAFVVAVWLILLAFYLPKQFVYRFSKKINKH